MSTALAINNDQTTWTPSQLSALKYIGCDKASPSDLQLFFERAKASGLDPFRRQIYLIPIQGRMTIVTGIDGLRAIGHKAARANGETLSKSAPEWLDPATMQWVSAWVHRDALPGAARVTVTRNGQPFTHTISTHEYNTGKAQWAQRPAHMAAKVAEAGAWRQAFPDEMSALYTDDEMPQPDSQRRPQRQQRQVLEAVIEDYEEEIK